jgi:hypothetical protein
VASLQCGEAVSSDERLCPASLADARHRSGDDSVVPPSPRDDLAASCASKGAAPRASDMRLLLRARRLHAPADRGRCPRGASASRRSVPGSWSDGTWGHGTCARGRVRPLSPSRRAATRLRRNSRAAPQGDTLEEATENARGALELYVDGLHEDGRSLGMGVIRRTLPARVAPVGSGPLVVTGEMLAGPSRARSPVPAITGVVGRPFVDSARLPQTGKA